jgi:hypothetical protein
MSIAISGSTITFADLTTQSSAAVSGGAFKNRIINGDFRIWQRGTTFSNPISSPNFYTADRWGSNRNSDVSGAVVSRISSGLTGFQYALALQRVAGNTGTESLSLWYTAESSDVYDLAGSLVTLSFWAKTGANYSGGALTPIIYSGTGIDQRVYNFTGLTFVASVNQTITSTWTRYTLTGTIPSNATEVGIQLTWVPTGTAGADDSVKFAGVQLEKGGSASGFEVRAIGSELALCQRYYETLTNDTEGICIASYFHLTNINRSRWFFKVTKRAQPTVNLVSGTSWASSLVPTIYPSLDNAGFYKTSTNFGTTGPVGVPGLYADAEL